nr:unnamed protein product [Callosobruchus analis]
MTMDRILKISSLYSIIRDK